MTKYDTIIIGAGIAGLFTALRLSKNGQKVLVVEKDKIGNGATIANHGTIHSVLIIWLIFQRLLKIALKRRTYF